MSLEDQLTGLNPILFCSQFGGIENDFWFLLLQRFQVTSRFAARSLNGIPPIDGANFQRIVLLRIRIVGRAIPLRERQFETGNLFVVPNPWDLRPKDLRHSRPDNSQNAPSDHAISDSHTNSHCLLLPPQMLTSHPAR